MPAIATGSAPATILGFYLLDVVLVWLSFRRADPRTAPMRAIAFGLGLPLLFTLERGNLILVAFACFVVAHGPLVTRGPWRWLASAATINFKPYLLLPVLAHAVKRDWRALELAGIATIVLYLVTLAIVGAGTPVEMVANTANWVAVPERAGVERDPLFDQLCTLAAGPQLADSRCSSSCRRAPSRESSSSCRS